MFIFLIFLFYLNNLFFLWPKRNKKTRGAMPRSPMLRDQSLRTLARKKYSFTFYLVPKKSRIESHLPPPWLQTLLSTRLKESISSGKRLCFLFRALAPQFLSRFFLTNFVGAISVNFGEKKYAQTLCEQNIGFCSILFRACFA